MSLKKTQNLIINVIFFQCILRSLSSGNNSSPEMISVDKLVIFNLWQILCAHTCSVLLRTQLLMNRFFHET